MMMNQTSELHVRIDAGQEILLAEISPPKSGDGYQVQERAKLYLGRVHALGVSDNRIGAAMSALAAASLVARQGVEPILHMVTRDRNRIALVSDFLGAQALGVHNFLCTTGTHQSLGPARAAKNVFDLDSIQLLQALANLGSDGALVGEERFDNLGPYCLGAAITQHAAPSELRVLRLAKKIEAGARFLITQPVFDVEGFQSFWTEVIERGMDEKVAILAGIRPLTNADTAREYARSRPNPRVPEAVIERLAAKTGAVDQESVGIAIAVETVRRLLGIPGLRGFSICADGSDHAALAVIEQCGLGVA